MRVYLAVQTFSATVAAGMENYLESYSNFGDTLFEIPDPSNKEIQNIMFHEKSPFKFKTALPIVDYRDLSLPIYISAETANLFYENRREAIDILTPFIEEFSKSHVLGVANQIQPSILFKAALIEPSPPL
ncbi:hypothetical protein QTP88_014398 [Uroleucon formosanum]